MGLKLLAPADKLLSPALRCAESMLDASWITDTVGAGTGTSAGARGSWPGTNAAAVGLSDDEAEASDASGDEDGCDGSIDAASRQGLSGFTPLGLMLTTHSEYLV